MICVTGDLHGDITRFRSPVLKKLRRGDALIITGDFGCIWDGSKKEKKMLKKLGKKKYNVLFAEGVHENFDLLEEYPVEQWCGGKTRLISGNLRQLMRGQYYTIAQKNVFVFGGGQSEENNSYLEPDDEKSWIKELPTDEELEEGLRNLEQHGNEADFIISYEPPARMIEFIDIGKTSRNHINTYLDKVLDTAKFKMWYFGKRHINKLIPPRYRCIFDAVDVADDTRLPKQKKQKPEKVKKEKPEKKTKKDKTMDSKTKQQTVQMGTGKITVSEITMCGVFAALTFLLTRYIQVQIIPAKGGLVHLGNVPMFFAAAFFGKRVGAICGGVGMALSDVLSPWIVYAPATLIVVGLMGFVFGLIVKKKPTIVNLIVATVVVLAIKLVGYYLFEVLLTSSFVVPLASIPGNIMQIVTGAIIAIPIILVSRVGMAKVKRSMEA